SYIDCQKHVSHAYRDTQTWTKMSILNAARIGYFSSDRAIQDYSRDIWHVQPVPIQLEEDAESRVPERAMTIH
ncbi:MAG: glycogen/starch/alpha-glucan phosphorylase, partial [Phormidesmis sp. CAN_BIN44]|nr:glycogen/starch/alpha-glucan phosphorylase [Phormidesmis sp. CAN_BIN44]